VWPPLLSRVLADSAQVTRTNLGTYPWLRHNIVANGSLPGTASQIDKRALCVRQSVRRIGDPGARDDQVGCNPVTVGQEPSFDLSNGDSECHFVGAPREKVRDQSCGAWRVVIEIS